MAHLLNLESVRAVAGTRVLLDAVSLGLDDGDRVGVVGRGGDGKTTLLSIMAGRRDPEGGRSTHRGGLRVGVLDQFDALPAGATVGEVVSGGRPVHAWAGDARVRDVVNGLLGGLDVPDVGGPDHPVEQLSGGQRRRVALAALLAGDHDLLLLDEPTNHLDVEGVDWLAEHLRRRWPAGRGALAVVTHDRWFLDAACTRTWEVHDGRVDAYDGGYAAFVLARAERARVDQVTQERRQNLLRKELAWLHRGAKARSTKPTYRVEAAQALIGAEPPPRDSVALARTAVTRLGKDVVDLHDVTVELGGRAVLDGLTWSVGPGDRIGLLGPNGAGKTTLLRLLDGSGAPDSGRVKRGKTVAMATLTQTLTDLDALADERALAAVQQVRLTTMIGDKEMGAGQLLERLGFDTSRQATRVGDLSGGERRRLQLLRLLLGEPNVLLLDEPTNDLDVDALTAVEDVLDDWPGTLVVASHDRYLLERVTDVQYGLMGDGRLRHLPGGVDEYLQRRRAAGAVAASGRDAPAASVVPDGGASAADVRQARKDMAKAERRLDALSRSEAKVHEEMAAHATDHERIAAASARLRVLQREREELEAAWLAAAETAD